MRRKESANTGQMQVLKIPLQDRADTLGIEERNFDLRLRRLLRFLNFGLEKVPKTNDSCPVSWSFPSNQSVKSAQSVVPPADLPICSPLCSHPALQDFYDSGTAPGLSGVGNDSETRRIHALVSC
jgi:hypothetical protein